MPVTIINCKDGPGVIMTRVYQHECTLGEFTHKLRELVAVDMKSRLEEGESRFSLYDLFNSVHEKLTSHDSNYVTGWQLVSMFGLLTENELEAIRCHNNDPGSVKVNKVIKD